MKKKEKYIGMTILSLFFLILYFVPSFIGMEKNAADLFHYVYFYLLMCLGILIFKKGYLLSPLVLFVVFFSKSIGLAPLFYTLSSGHYMPRQYSIIIYSLILFLVGYIIVSFILPKNKSINSTEQEKNHNNNKMSKLFCYALIGISLIADAIYLYKNFGILFGGSYNDGRITALSGNGMIIELMGLGSIGLCILFELLLEKKVSKKIFILLSLIVLPATLIKGFRSALITPIIIMCLIYSKKRKVKNKTIILIGVASVFAIGVLGVVREVLSSSGSNNLLTSLYSMFRNGSINLNAILLTFPSKVPFQKGYSYLINFIMLKPGPDLDFTLWLKEMVGYTFSGGGMTPTIIGEFYLNFNYIGIYIGMFISGMVFKLIEKYYFNSQNSYYASFVLFTFLGCLGGGFANAEISFIITTIVYIAFVLTNKFFKRDVKRLNEKKYRHTNISKYS